MAPVDFGTNDLVASIAGPPGYGPVASSQQFALLCFDSDSAIHMFMQIAETVCGYVCLCKLLRQWVHVFMQIAETTVGSHRESHIIHCPAPGALKESAHLSFS